MVTQDLMWLAGKSTLVLLAPELTSSEARTRIAHSAEQGFKSAAVYPTHVSYVPDDWEKIVGVGVPTGRQQPLIKASEARLAIEYGAEEIWLALDHDVTDPNVLLSEIVAVRQAVPEPARMAVLAHTADHVRAARRAGVGVVGSDADADVVLVSGLEEAVEKLEVGARRLGTDNPWELA